MSDSKTKKRDTKDTTEDTTKEKKEGKTKEKKKTSSENEGGSGNEKKSKHREDRGKKKQKLIEALPEELSDSDSDDEEKKISRVGYLEIKKKDRWKPYYCCLVGGSFFYYRTSQGVEPQGTVHLKGSLVKKLEPSGDPKKEMGFGDQNRRDYITCCRRRFSRIRCLGRFTEIQFKTRTVPTTNQRKNQKTRPNDRSQEKNRRKRSGLYVRKIRHKKSHQR
eukprot:TRINITY_DN1559_c0_g1_i1.p1 TRINITY_DN1559_c0_g1~~TRINITY_DN1559_c0_g1_i1.p1  ORF type:complete len:220 (+),score=53.16 TRINITY_DN1559_c0_g1_i1:90-749(+)